jgi:catechol 2,3-dioxygenase-like lactoylglutathione lyase family enzyme
VQDTKTGVRRPSLIGLAHMAFQSSDLEKAIDYYREILGYEELLRVSGPGGAPDRAFVGINDSQWIELRPEHEAGSDRLLEFGFQVEDAEAWRAYLASRGIAVPGSVAVGATGNLGFHAMDPDGHAVEFLQYLQGGWPSRAVGSAAGSKPLSSCLMHTGFDVRSMEKAMAFYRDTLGCVETWRGSSDGRTLSWVHLRLPEDRNYVEFMLYDEPPSLERLGVFNHFGLEVPSVPAAMEFVAGRRAAGGFPRAVEYGIGTCRHRLANVFDPDGTRAEFMERGTFDGSVTPSSPAPPPA